jgi:hypothetical protein
MTSLRVPTRTLTRCLVCGFAEVRSDEVVDRGTVLLHECPRCAHRWTGAVAVSSPAARALRRVGGPLAPAA